MGSNDVLQLNVGGRTGIAVFRRTLTQFEGSVLATQFSGRWDDNLARDRDGNFFLDQDPDDFAELLSFLRKRLNHVPSLSLSHHPPPNKPTIPFLEMLAHFGLLEALYPPTLDHLNGGTKPGSFAVDSLPGWTFKIQTSELATFRPQVQNVDLPLISIEVEIQEASCLRMGYSYHQLQKTGPMQRELKVVPHSVAHEFSPVELVEGNRLTCRIFIRPSNHPSHLIEWLVNGETVNIGTISASYPWFPYLCVMGTVEIVSIVVGDQAIETTEERSSNRAGENASY